MEDRAVRAVGREPREGAVREPRDVERHTERRARGARGVRGVGGRRLARVRRRGRADHHEPAGGLEVRAQHVARRGERAVGDVGARHREQREGVAVGARGEAGQEDGGEGQGAHGGHQWSGGASVEGAAGVEVGDELVGELDVEVGSSLGSTAHVSPGA